MLCKYGQEDEGEEGETCFRTYASVEFQVAGYKGE